VGREVLEETGYRHVLQIEQMECVSHGFFYHVVKHENRLAHYHLVFAKLKDLEQQEVSEEEQAIAKFIWVPKDEVEGVLTREDMKKLWRFYVRNLSDI
jgi:8-oxo-dGTP pyrophosphatase MutT (NUDIX family)